MLKLERCHLVTGQAARDIVKDVASLFSSVALDAVGYAHNIIFIVNLFCAK